MESSDSGRRLIDGRFELAGPLGSGGMGTVWRARDIALHRDVALKEVRPPDPATAAAQPDLAVQLRERAVREARALARLAHPNVVTIHHIVEPADGVEGHPWIVMELVKGGSLHDRLASGPMPVADVLRLGLDVLSALRAAHAEGVLHRDVKPANVLLRTDGSAVLTDFGIAALHGATALTSTGVLIGSPEYIAPERARGEEGLPASDLWSLGMLLYVASEGCTRCAGPPAWPPWSRCSTSRSRRRYGPARWGPYWNGCWYGTWPCGPAPRSWKRCSAVRAVLSAVPPR